MRSYTELIIVGLVCGIVSALTAISIQFIILATLKGLEGVI